MALSKGFAALAVRLEESSLILGLNDIRAALSDELRDMYPQQDAYLLDVYGDSESGDVVFSVGDNTYKAPYEIGTVNGKRTCAIDDEAKIDVLPRTVYDEEADEGDNYAGMAEADKTLAKSLHPMQRRMLFSERFVSKKTRDAMDSGDFAGKGQSFPIKSAQDVEAAARSIGRAGSDNYSASVIKANIIKIAKRKGFTSSLPKAWQDGATPKESSTPQAVTLVESAVDFRSVGLTEADAVNPTVKIINEGRGSAGYYTAEVLKRDGPSVFKSGTLMYVNHATPAEEAARPEGDWNKLAAVTVGNAYWDDNGKDGPALYAPAKVFSDYAQQIREKAPYTGVSIRAGGRRDDKSLAPDGKPGLVTRLTHAESIDLVTKAGRGGKLLLEAASAVQMYEASRGTQSQTTGDEMDEATVKALIEAQVKPIAAENKLLKSQLAMIGAPTAIREALATINLPDASKDRIVSALSGNAPLTEAGEIDTAKLKLAVEAAAKTEADYLSKLPGFTGVKGLGTPAAAVEGAPVIKPEEVLKESESVFARLFGAGNDAAVKAAARGRAA